MSLRPCYYSTLDNNRSEQWRERVKSRCNCCCKSLKLVMVVTTMAMIADAAVVVVVEKGKMETHQTSW